MIHRRPVRDSGPIRSTVLAVAFVIGAALIGVAVSKIFVPYGEAGAGVPEVPVTGVSSDRHRGGDRPDDEGHVRDGVTVFNDGVPGVTNLDPALLTALRSAARDAAGDGVEFYLNSGWRSVRYQDQLLRDAIEKYGSVEEASRWVAAPDKSAHVSGDAVDLGPSAATDWLSEHGAGYGLCQIYQNEPWHFELRPEAADRGCPAMYADPTQDPRMQ